MVDRKSYRRPFGTVRRLPSGRFQVRYTGPDGIRRAAPDTFRTKRDAEQWMSITESELVRGDWADPLRGSELLADFGERWIAEHRVSQRVREEYDSLWAPPPRPLSRHLRTGPDHHGDGAELADRTTLSRDMPT